MKEGRKEGMKGGRVYIKEKRKEGQGQEHIQGGRKERNTPRKVGRK